MTPLKPSEKRLLTVFGIGAFFLVNVLGFNWYSKRKIALEQQSLKLGIRSSVLEGLKARAPEAERKQEYLAQHLKAYPSDTERDGYLDSFISSEASKLNLELKKNRIEEAKLEDLFHKSRYSGEVTGRWDNVLEFIYHLQQPTDFRFVPSLSLKSQKKEAASEDAADVVCAFSIEKWWSPTPVEVVPPAPEPPATANGAAATPASPDSEHSAEPAVENQNATAVAAATK